MKRLFFTLSTAAILFSCTTAKHQVYPGNFSKYSYHGHKLRQQADSLYKSDTTGKCLVMIIKGKPTLVCQ